MQAGASACDRHPRVPPEAVVMMSGYAPFLRILNQCGPTRATGCRAGQVRGIVPSFADRRHAAQTKHQQPNKKQWPSIIPSDARRYVCGDGHYSIYIMFARRLPYSPILKWLVYISYLYILPFIYRLARLCIQAAIMWLGIGWMLRRGDKDEN